MSCTPLTAELHREDVGDKAANLSTMLRAGYPVPNGFAISVDEWRRGCDNSSELRTASDVCVTLNSSGSQPGVTSELRDELAASVDRLRSERVMVRSSAVGEDSQGASFAGQLDSFQCARTVDEIADCIERCWASYDKESVRVYQAQKGVALTGMGVIVQELIDPDYAGVLFTRAPDNRDEMLCEYVEGHGEKLVSGAVTPTAVRFDRDPHRARSGSGDAALASLVDLALRLEDVFGSALDIEWVVRDGALSIVQARPITVSAPVQQVRWSNTNVNENYPGPITPLLYSIARESYYHYFKNLSRLLQVPEQAIRELEPDYANIIGAFGCRMYYNMTSIHNVIGRSPFASLLRKSFDNFVGYQEGPAAHQSSSRIGSAARFAASFARLSYRLRDNVREFERRADEFQQQCDAARELASLRECYHAFIEIRMHSWYRASLADFFAMVYHGLIGAFCRRHFKDEHQSIHNTLVQAIPGLISSHPVAEIWKIGAMMIATTGALGALRTHTSIEMLDVLRSDERFRTINDAVNAYLSTWGFRCSGELMLTEENFCDAPERFIDLLRGYIEQLVENPEANPEDIIREKARERVELMSTLRRRLVRQRGWLFPLAVFDIAALELLVRLCFAGIASRERVRLKQAQLYYGFKSVVQRVGDELVRRDVIDRRDDALFLRYEELGEILSTSDMLPGTLKELVALRRIEFERASKLEYPDDFSSAPGAYPQPERPAAAGDAGHVIRGLSACGGRVRGRVRVLANVMELGRIRRGDILVTRQTDPGWATVFPLISGLIVERGGMLSHGAIVAREFGIPAIIGVANATTIFEDDEEVELNADRGEVYRDVVDARTILPAAI